MICWERYTHNLRDYGTLFLLLAISILLIINNNAPQTSWVRANVLNVMGIWGNWLSSISQYGSLKQENESLRNRMAELSYENSLMKEAYLENDRLRRMLDFKNKSRYDLIPASIVVRNYEGFSHAFLLDAGKADGVLPNMPVLASEGLVGRVVSVTNYNTVVQVLDDLSYRVGAMIQRSRLTGIAQSVDGSKIILNYIKITDDVKVGDVVITSGSAIYPKGIEIGIVTKVEAPPAALFKDIEVEPSVNLEKLEVAFIIKIELRANQ
jgi:rod shape-determining protein MreC